MDWERPMAVRATALRVTALIAIFAFIVLPFLDGKASVQRL
jgi:hypothetical protein